MTTQNDTPDYKIAKEEAQTLFDSLGLTVTISDPFPNVRDEWASIGYNILFVKGTRNLAVNYFLGTGHVKYPNALPFKLKYKGSYIMENLLYAKKDGKMINKDYVKQEAELASALAEDQKVKPNPVEVMACICSESIESNHNTFEEWASNFGYDTDSKKAEKMYDDCAKNYPALIGLIGLDNMQKFADFQCRF